MTKRSDTATDERILELHRAGRTARAIAATLNREGTPLTKSSVDRRLAGLAAEGTPVRGKSARSPSSSKPTGGGSALRGQDITIPADTGDSDIDATRSRLRRVAALLDANEAAAMNGEISMSSWASLARLEADLVDRVVSQVVPTPPDPANDPTNLAESEACLGRLASAVRAAEEVALCQHCHQRPYP